MSIEDSVPSLIIGLMNRDTGEVTEIELGNLTQQLALMAISEESSRDAVMKHCIDTMAMIGAYAAANSPEEDREEGIELTATLAAKAISIQIKAFEDMPTHPHFLAALAEVAEATVSECDCNECSETDSPVIH